MNSIPIETLDDLTTSTLNSFKRDTYADISQSLQSHHFSSRFFKGKQKPEKGGSELEWRLKVRGQNNATYTGLFDVDDLNRVNMLSEGKQQWSLQKNHYLFDYRESVFTSNAESIIKHLEVLETDLAIGFIDLMEVAIWTAPASSDERPRRVSGIPFWVQKYNSSTPGFNGGDPTGFSDGAGNIKTSRYPGWKNYAGLYSQVSRDDLIEKIINAMDFCHFEPPVQFNQLGGGQPDWGLYSTHGVLSTCRKLLQAGNDNLGPDVAQWSNNVMIRSVPLQWIPALTNADSDCYDSSDPVYGINWNTMDYFFHSGLNMVKTPPFRNANSHMVRERWMDNSGNMVCYDRRRNFVFSTSA